jgi:hypothetical protein
MPGIAACIDATLVDAAGATLGSGVLLHAINPGRDERSQRTFNIAPSCFGQSAR